MSYVKVKRSILENLIKKTLFESDSVSEKLIKPDDSALPSDLPLKPDNKLIVDHPGAERPPVEDDEYIPDNSKELGLAMKALSEMIPAENVGAAYDAMKKAIESINNQPDENVEGSDVNMATLDERKRMALKKMVIKTLNEIDGADDDDWEEEEDPKDPFGKGFYRDVRANFGSDDVDDDDPKSRESDDLHMFKNEDEKLIKRFIMNTDTISDIEDAIGGNEDEREKFLSILRMLENIEGMKHRKLSDNKAADAEIRQKYIPPAEQLGEEFHKNLTDMAKKDISSFDLSALIYDTFDDLSDIMDSINDLVGTEKFEYQTQAPKYGYGAASGLRQTMVRDLQGVRMVQQYWQDDDIIYVQNNSKKRFLEILNNKDNAKFLRTLFDDEGLDEYINEIDKNPKALIGSLIYRNFEGLLSYITSQRISDMKFGEGISEAPKSAEDIADALESNGFDEFSEGDASYMLELVPEHLSMNELNAFIDFLSSADDSTVTKLNDRLMTAVGQDEATLAKFIKTFTVKMKSSIEKPLGREVGKSFQSDFPENKPINKSEIEQIEKMIDQGLVKKVFDQVISDAYNKSKLLAAIGAAASMAAEDIDVGVIGKYTEPAFASLKKYATRVMTGTPGAAIGIYQDAAEMDPEYAKKYQSDVEGEFKSILKKDKNAQKASEKNEPPAKKMGKRGA
jgi:hypothetical protein